MKKIIFPFFSKNNELKVDIPIRTDRSKFYVRINFDPKNDLVYFYILSNIDKKLEETIISYIDQAYKDYLNKFTDLQIWNIKRIFYLLYKFANTRVFDFKLMKKIDVITSSMNDEGLKNIARTIKQNGEIVTIINNNELINQSITNFMNFHYLNFQLLNALVSIDLVSLLNERNKTIIKNFIGIVTLVIFNIPTFITIFNCIINEKLFSNFFECFTKESSNIFFINYILTILSPIVWFVLPKIVQFIFRHYFYKLFKKHVFVK
jgi:hypothetical protein